MIDNEERPEETRKSVDSRAVGEQLYDLVAAHYRRRPLRRWLFVQMARNNVVAAGVFLVILAEMILLSWISIGGLKDALEDWQSWRPLLRDGITTQAIVLDGTRPGSDGHRIRYMYQATTTEGIKTFENREYVTRFKSYEVGEEVTIIYDPAEPSHSGIEGNQLYRWSFVLYLCGTCTMVPIAVLMIVVPLNALRKRLVQWVRG
jgi:hypothetical protein